MHWEDCVDDLNIIPDKTEFKLWLPEAKGRQKVFKRFDIQKQRVLHKNDFPRALESIGISIGAVTNPKKVLLIVYYYNLFTPEFKAYHFSTFFWLQEQIISSWGFFRS